MNAPFQINEGVVTMDRIEEVADLVAEAARVSRHAKLAYERLRDEFPDLQNLDARQRLIAGRMSDVA